jgi:hypothetical protein
MSIGDLVLGPNYQTFGRPATLTVAGTDYAVTVIDRTRGARVLDGVETLVPLALVRATELAGLGLALGQLDEALLTIDSTAWRVRSAEPMPAPDGEAAGEYQLALEEQ